jgi:hypothetical protein
VLIIAALSFGGRKPALPTYITTVEALEASTPLDKSQQSASGMARFLLIRLQGKGRVSRRAGKLPDKTRKIHLQSGQVGTILAGNSCSEELSQVGEYSHAACQR